MRETNGPISFRVSSQERNQLELVAAARGETLAGFARNAVVTLVNHYVDEAGPDELMRQARRNRREALNRDMARFEQAANDLDLAAAPRGSGN